tara:strand:+ start:9904 stop:10326 length:423 start_codon:yes stop_codon:yes gene_type:complete
MEDIIKFSKKYKYKTKILEGAFDYNSVAKYINTEKCNLVLFDTLNKDLTKLECILSKEELMKDKYVNGIICFTTINEKTAVVVFKKIEHMKEKYFLNTLNQYNICKICNQTVQHVQIEDETGECVCMRCLPDYCVEKYRN